MALTCRYHSKYYLALVGLRCENDGTYKQPANVALLPEVGSKYACKCEQSTFMVKDSNWLVDGVGITVSFTVVLTLRARFLIGGPVDLHLSGILSAKKGTAKGA